MADQQNTLDAPAGFSSDWLRMREPADHLARSVSLTQSLVAWRESFTHFNVVDLGSGTASNFRYLCPTLGFKQSWTLLDNDAGLLSCISDRLQQWANEMGFEYHLESDTSATLEGDAFSAKVHWQSCDLAADMPTIDFTQTQLITGSALLDLTSARWLEQLANIIDTTQCASLFVLSYNGSIDWQPPCPFDAELTALLNTHQTSDKGFGNALGPHAHAFFQQQLTTHLISTATSDWLIGGESNAMQNVLCSDWTQAAIEQNPEVQDEISTWSVERRQFIAREASTLRVGHVDILTLPANG